MECGNCKEKGHLRRDCPNEPVCFACGEKGHKRGSDSCRETIKDFGLERDQDDNDGSETDDVNPTSNEVSIQAEENAEDITDNAEGEAENSIEEGKNTSQRTKYVVNRKLKELKEKQEMEEAAAAKDVQQKVHQALLTKFMASKVSISPNQSPRGSPRVPLGPAQV